MATNFPNLKKEIDPPSPGSTENPKQNKSKEANINTHNNQNGKG